MPEKINRRKFFMATGAILSGAVATQAFAPKEEEPPIKIMGLKLPAGFKTCWIQGWLPNGVFISVDLPTPLLSSYTVNIYSDPNKGWHDAKSFAQAQAEIDRIAALPETDKP